MWRVLFDGVVYSNAFDTFVVVCVMMCVLVGFETAFGYLRAISYCMSRKRVDTKLSTYIFDKLIRLPVDFF